MNNLKWVNPKERQPPMSGVYYFCKVKNLVTGLEEKRTIYSTRTGFEHPETFMVLFWLDEDYKPVPTSLEGCPFMYCDKNPKCEGECRYAKS